MLREEAMALVDALRAELHAGPVNADSRWCRDSVEAVSAEAVESGKWTVVVHWTQGPFVHGLRVRDLDELWPAGAGTIEDAAKEVRLPHVEEPHGRRGEQNASGRYWL